MRVIREMTDMMNANTKRSVLVTALITFSLLSTESFAQYGMSNARSLAMGSAYTSVARGVESPAWNPANLALTSQRKYHFNLLSIGVGLHNNSFNKNHYDLYNGKYLTEQDKLDILNSIPEQGLYGDIATEIQAVGFSIGAFAITTAGHGASDFVLSKDIVDLVLNGNELNRAYDLGATDGEAWGVSSVALSMAFPIAFPMFKEFSVGTSIKYLRGMAYAKVIENSSTMTTTVAGLTGQGRVVIDRALGGSGLGFDLGMAGRFDSKWSMSLSLTNISSKVSWNKDTERFTYTFVAESISAQELEDSEIDSLFKDDDETVAIEPFDTSLPRQIRIGFARTTKRFTLGVDFSKGFQKAPGVSTQPLLAMGTEFRLIQMLPIRTGVAFGGERGMSPSAGFGLDFSLFSWNFAIASREGISSSSKGIAVAFDWMFRF